MPTLELVQESVAARGEAAAGAAARAQTAPFFADLARRARAHDAGTEIAFEGEEIPTVFWVLEGWIGLPKTLEDGREQLIDIVLPGDVVMPVSCDGLTAAFGLQALTDASVAALPRALFDEARYGSQALRNIVDSLDAAARARRAERLLRIGQGSARERVAHALIELFVRLNAIGQTDRLGYRLPLKQQQLGEFTGLSGVHICRTLRALTEAGAIAASDHRIRFLDLALLARIAKTDIARLSEEILAPGSLRVETG